MLHALEAIDLFIRDIYSLYYSHVKLIEIITRRVLRLVRLMEQVQIPSRQHFPHGTLYPSI